MKYVWFYTNDSNPNGHPKYKHGIQSDCPDMATKLKLDMSMWSYKPVEFRDQDHLDLAMPYIAMWDQEIVTTVDDNGVIISEKTYESAGKYAPVRSDQ